MRWPGWLRELPVVSRCLVVGCLTAGIVGGVAGLIVGIVVNPRTAWFAVFELGVPSAAAGAVLGVIAGVVVVLLRRART